MDCGLQYCTLHVGGIVHSQVASCFLRLSYSRFVSLDRERRHMSCGNQQFNMLHSVHAAIHGAGTTKRSTTTRHATSKSTRAPQFRPYQHRQGHHGNTSVPGSLMSSAATKPDGAALFANGNYIQETLMG